MRQTGASGRKSGGGTGDRRQLGGGKDQTMQEGLELEELSRMLRETRGNAGIVEPQAVGNSSTGYFGARQKG